MDRGDSTFALFLALVKQTQLDIELPRLALEMTLEELSRSNRRGHDRRSRRPAFRSAPSGIRTRATALKGP